MKNISLDKEGIEKLIRSNKSVITTPKGVYSTVDLFTTEDIRSLYKVINSYYGGFKNKKILAVESSGDHRLNALLLGLNEIITFDINRTTPYYADFKSAAIEALDYDEFALFFKLLPSLIKTSSKDYESSIKLMRQFYERISDTLSLYGEAIEIWDMVFNTNEDPFHNLIDVQDYDIFIDNDSYNMYLSEDKINYMKLQEILKNKRERIFLPVDLCDLSKELGQEKFDIILLSDINHVFCGYPSLGMVDPNKIKEFEKLVATFDKHINNDGIIVCAYTCSLPNQQINEELIKYQAYFKPSEYLFNQINQKDNIIIRKKMR